MNSFLRSKLSGVKVGEIVIGQLEALIVGAVDWIPTIVGMLIRNVVYRLLGMKISGFCWIQPRVMIVNMRRLRVGKNLVVIRGPISMRLAAFTWVTTY